ncbi:MAG: fatty acid--CoA ligase family protein [Candidatus Hodarchaeota archaeon]
MGIGWLIGRMAQWKDEPAIVWNDQPFTYRQILEAVEFWDKELNAEGVLSGDVVALEGDYSPNACALLIALIAHKNIVVPLTSVADSHGEEFMNTAEVQIVFSFDEQDQHKVRRRSATVKNPLTLKLISASEPGLVLFSSGSTGKNKAALHNFTFLLEKYKVVRKRMCTITFLLLDHIGGINTLFYTLSNGGTVVSVQGRDPEVVCQAIQRHTVELLPTSPTFLNLVLISEAYRQYDLSSLKLITYGTEVMPESTLRRVREIFPNVQLLQTYGLSELGILRSKSKDSSSPWVKIGGEGFETKVVDGVLWIRARSSMLGYLNAPSPFDEDGWMNTQDMVEVDGDYIRILGRTSDIINVGGQKVYPAEVESILMQMDNVRDATVRGEKNPITGNIVVARLVLEKTEELPRLKRRVRQFCKGQLENYKIPVKVEIAEDIEYMERFKKVRA